MIQTTRFDLTPARRPDAMSTVNKAGLEDVVVSTSDICFIDGREGRLIYRGFDVDDLVAQSTFEEVVYLLWYGSLPTKKEYDAFYKALTSTATRTLPPKLIALLRTLPKKTTPMEGPRTGVSALSAFDPDHDEQVMLMVDKIKDPAKAEAWIKKAIADKARIMGFGHRVYRVEDPRAKHLRRLATELGKQNGDDRPVKILNIVARVMTEEKHIYPNVDLFSGAGYAPMGIPTDHFTPIFAMSRVAGWAAHVLEQHGNNRLIRPRAEHTGATRATYVPIAQR